MVNYYRARLQLGQGNAAQVNRWPMSVLVLWGMQDAALLPDHADGLEPWVPDLRVVGLPHASHWVMYDEPMRVTNLLLGFFAEG